MTPLEITYWCPPCLQNLPVTTERGGQEGEGEKEHVFPFNQIQVLFLFRNDVIRVAEIMPYPGYIWGLGSGTALAH